MGYSARYHAASLAAVFLALAIGILIGVEFGEDVVSGTSENLEESLKGDLEESRDRVSELDAALDREREFAERAYPALVGDLLGDKRVGLIALGGLSEDISGDIERALGPTGGELSEVAVVREPPDLEGLAERLEGTRFERVDRDDSLVEELGAVAGRQLVKGGRIIRDARDQLLTRVSGGPGRIDAVILVRERPDDLDSAEAETTSRLESGIVDGIGRELARVVGVERSDDEDSSVEFFDSHDVSTVDSLDLSAGQVAMVFALRGAEGTFGIKDSADSLLPELSLPSGTRPKRVP